MNALRYSALLIAASLTGSVWAQEQAARISHARLLRQPVEGSLATTIRDVGSKQTEAWWAAWDEPTSGRRQMCCFESLDDFERSASGGRCFLESENRRSNTFDGDSDDGLDQDEGGRVRIFARIENGQTRRLRIFSQDCAVDAEGKTVVWLDGVSPAQSVAFLEKLVVDSSVEGKKQNLQGEPALSAIAMHADPAADAALERFVAAGMPDGVRRQAAFWLGNARGKRGDEVLRKLAQTDKSDDLRRHITFALSQSQEPRAIETLLGMARNDSSPSVRGQALFWLAQKAGRKAAAAIREAIADDPETEVKRRAVFALTQLPKDESVPELIRVARSNRNAAVRKQAMFWLGQSQDPRALAFFEEVLTK